MVIIASIHIVIYFYLGFILGFSKSPYNHNIKSILKNLFIQILPVISIEVVRSVILIRNKKNKFLLLITTIILILVEIKYNTLLSLFSNKEELFKYICEKIFPLIFCSFLYTYLALKGSYSLPLVYRLFKESINLLLPILPDIDWFVRGTVPIISSVIVYTLYKYKFTKEDKDFRKKKENILSKLSYTITLMLAISLVCFMLGFFKYEPIAILSNSMSPTFSRADVVIYKKLKEDELNELPNNSIIIYTLGKQNIAHRIVDIVKDEKNTRYQTKGDRNNMYDPNIVEVNQIKGIYVFHIKYIGYPSVWLYEFFNN